MSILIYNYYRYPVVRKKAAEKLYIFIIGMEDPSLVNLGYDEIDEVNVLLSEVNWGEPVKNVKEKRNTIAKLLNINIEAVKPQVSK